MRAVVCEAGDLEVAELPDPELGPRQVLLDVTGCGICGSDLHVRHHADAQADILAAAGYDGFARSHQRVVLGHEFCGTVAGYGPGARRRVKIGTPVVALPLIRKADGMHAIGLSASAPGAYAEQVVIEEAFMMPLPGGLSAELAVLTEPMAVARHAVNRAEISKKDVAVVVGCGPVGLAVICMLKARGLERIVASDLSPARRALATACGASDVVDPTAASPYDAMNDRRFATSIAARAGAGLRALTSLQRLPVPWHVVLRGLGRVGGTAPRGPVVFECVGVPGMIDGIIAAAPLDTRVVVVGVCMEPDQFRPAMAINKQIDLRFVVGYDPLEFRDTLHVLAEGSVDVAPLISGTVGLAGTEAAFEALRDPEQHAKIVIDPRSTATTPAPP